jgi:hypothetical protein
MPDAGPLTLTADRTVGGKLTHELRLAPNHILPRWWH